MRHVRDEGIVTRTADVLGIAPAAQPAWLALRYALDRLAERGRRPVCETRPDQWSADAHGTARRDAAEACMFCPALHPCASFAQAADERVGVWGGTDRGLRPTPSRPKEATHARR